MHGPRVDSKISLDSELSDFDKKRNTNVNLKLRENISRTKDNREIDKSEVTIKAKKYSSPKMRKKAVINIDTLPDDENDNIQQEARKLESQIISFPSQKNQSLQLMQANRKRSYTPFKYKTETKNSEKERLEMINLKISDKIIKFNNAGNVNKLLKKSSNSNIISTQNSGYEFPKNLKMFSKKNFEKLKKKSIKKKFNVNLEKDIEEVKNIDHMEFKSIISDFGSSSKMGKTPKNPLKPNQDSYIQRPNLATKETKTPSDVIIEQIHLFGV